MPDHRLVYSTETGRICPECGRAADRCRCKKRSPADVPRPFPVDGVVRIRRETQGRKGKTACVIYGLNLKDSELEELARSLKQRCGAGGSVKDGAIVIQGDHRDLLRDELVRKGYAVKLAGG